MIPITEMVDGPVRWLEGAAPLADRILSTRVRFARNIAGVRFPGRAIDEELSALADRVTEIAMGTATFDDGGAVRIAELTILDRQFLLERHLISHDLVNSDNRALVLSQDERESILLNEEDHVRIQALRPGFQLEEAFEAARQVDECLQDELGFASHPELGYLTACPTNVGTGMRASVLIHLPALVLTQRIKKILAGVNQVGLTVRGFRGEGTEVVGNFFQISNQVTLGETETETRTKLERVVRQILDWEEKAQSTLLHDASLQIEDKVLRALGTLKYSRLLSSQELMGLLSAVRFGHTLGMRNVPDASVFNDMLLRCQPAHIQKAAGREMSSEERNAYRARHVQRVLGVTDVPYRDESDA